MPKKTSIRKSKSRFGPCYWHEALDRSCVAMEHFNQFVAEHPVIESDPGLRAIADEASLLLYKLYNTIGGRTIGVQTPSAPTKKRR